MLWRNSDLSIKPAVIESVSSGGESVNDGKKRREICSQYNTYGCVPGDGVAEFESMFCLWCSGRLDVMRTAGRCISAICVDRRSTSTSTAPITICDGMERGQYSRT